jgi:hypothetical protein
MINTIPLPSGESITVDPSLLADLQKYKWYLAGKGYAATDIWLGQDCMPRKKTIYMHRLITGSADGMDVDHKNGDRLDNRTCNLRQASRSQNLANQGVRDRNKTGVKGVTRVGSKFMAQITYHKQHYYLGRFDTIQEASQVYMKRYMSIWGEFSKT